MADITPSFIRGFIAPFKLTSDHYWSSQSTVTQNGSLAGVPVPSEGADMALLTKGEQTQTVEVTTHRGGHVVDGAGFVWKYEGDNRDYGLEVPNKVMDVRNLVITTIHENIARDAVRLSSGVVLVSYENKTTLEINARVARIDVDGSVTTAFIDTSDIADLNGNRTYPALCEMPDGSVLCVVWGVDAEVANIGVWRSKDEGLTWSKVSSRGLTDDIDIAGSYGSGASGFKLQPLTLSANNHHVLLLAGLYAHNTSLSYGTIVKQFYSTNGGLQYTFVDESSTGDASHFYLPKVVQHNGVFIIAYISATDTISFTRIEDASNSIYEVLGVIPADTLSANLAVGVNNRLEDGDYTFYKDTDGRLYLYAIDLSQILILGAYSDLMGIGVDAYGAEWENWTDSLNFDTAYVADFRGSSTGGGVKNIVGVSGQGEQLLMCNYNNIGTNAFDDSLSMLTLGGWTSQQYPRLQPYPNDNQWGYNTQTWVPFDKPGQNNVWLRGVVGVVTESLGGDHITLVCNGTSTLKYYVTPASKTNGLTMQTRIDNVSGGSTTAGVAIGARMQTQTTTNTYWFEVVVNATAIYVYNKHTSTLIGSATGLSLPSGIQLLVYLDNSTGQLYVYYADAGSPRQYLSISGTLTTSTSTIQQVYWGIPGTNSAQRRADFHFFTYGTGDANGIRWSPNDLNARRYTGRGFYTTIKDGLQISTSSGPAYETDEYSIAPQYGSPVQRVLHSVSPSPQVGYRSDQVADPDVDRVPAQTFAWMMDTTLEGSADTHIQTECVGIHLQNINFKSFSVEKYAGGSWSKIATVRNSVGGTIGADFNFTRAGASVTCTDANNIYLHLNECRGWSIRLDDGAGNVVVRRILSNGDGVLANTSTKRAYLHLQGVKSTDPTTGTAHLIPDSCTVLLNHNTFAGLRISADTDQSAEGYFEVGTMVMGPVVITSPQYGRGRTVEFSANVIDNEAPNGTLYSQRAGNGGRLVRISWTDGVDTSALNANPATPDHYNLYSGAPIAVQGSAPTSMMGLVDYLDGSAEAVVYLPSIPTLPIDPVVINRYHEHICCTLGTSMQIDHVIGDEMQADNEGEVFRVATLILREVR
jgi:hypothetical protein